MAPDPYPADPYPSNACPPELRRAVVERYVARTPSSKHAHDRASHVLPGGVNRNIVHHGPHPMFVASGAGPYLTDLDGNRYLDLIGNYTAMILGNCVPQVMEAAARQLALGTAWAGATTGEAALAEMIVERLPSAELVRFAASGTEATMMALRAARAFTGRPAIAKFEGGYHGIHDFAMISVAPDPNDSGPDEAPRSVATPGIAPSATADVLVLPFNDAKSVTALIERHAHRLAAIIVEPVLANAGLLEPEPGFLPLLRDLTTKHGIVLIFDEVITLRLDYGGAQAMYGVTPDMTTLGKIIGGGYPIGGIAGRADIMNWFDPTKAGGSVTLSGTFHGAPMALAAGIETLKLFTADSIEALNGRSARLARELRAMFERASLTLSLNQVGSLLNVHAMAENVSRYRSGARGDKAFLKLLHLAMLNEGVLLSPRGLFCLSVPMDDAAVDSIRDAFGRALAALGVLGER
ncbi:MAG: aspartate aminotransferase family protein [Dongiaceae bacterium]